MDTSDRIPDQKTRTMSTIWAADNITPGNPLHAYYAQAVTNRATVAPGLPPLNLFPQIPYTAQDLQQAKNGVLPPPPPAPAPAPAPAPPVPAPPALPPTNPPGHAPTSRAAPFRHWPSQARWEFDNDPVNKIPTAKPGADDWRTQVADWLGSHQTTNGGEDDADEYYNWHGARLLGIGGFGVAGLWVKLNEDHIVEDVCESEQKAWNDFSSPSER